MKKIFFFVAFVATVFVQRGFAQDSTKAQPSELLHSYYDVKNALVAGNANLASNKAEEFVKTLNNIPSGTIGNDSRNALLKDAGAISETKEIKRQRENFAGFSANMYALVKAVKLTTQPVYYDYCPMKKTHWLSSDKTIKNPYFGSSMPTCGKVEETIK